MLFEYAQLVVFVAFSLTACMIQCMPLSPFYSIARSVQRISYACMHILNAKLTCHKHDNMLNLLFLQVSMINCFYRLRLKISSYLVHHIMCHDWSIRIENILVFLSYTMSPPIHFQYIDCFFNSQIIFANLFQNSHHHW